MYETDWNNFSQIKNSRKFTKITRMSYAYLFKKIKKSNRQQGYILIFESKTAIFTYRS